MENAMIDRIMNKATACAAGCIGDVCDTVGTQSACGGCCGCLERCAVKGVEDQLRHPLVSAAAQERVRQMQMEGYARDHDDQHRNGELARAAASYAMSGVSRMDPWPWDGGRKPSDNRGQELVKAVALLMAEWDRLERDRLADLSQDRPVLIPRELCDGYQEIWYGGSGWYLRLWPNTQAHHGRWMARLLNDGPPTELPAAGDTQREAVAAVLRQVMSDAQADEIAAAFPADVDVSADYLVDLAQEKLQQAPSRGYHPDQAVVREDSGLADDEDERYADQ